MLRILTWLAFLVPFFLLNCSDSLQVLDGKELASTYCASCHLLPAPDQLDRSTWQKYILPRMGHRLGFYQNPLERDSLFENNEGGAHVAATKIFPTEPIITLKEWQAIQNYYLTAAPDELEVINLAAMDTITLFEPRFPDLYLSPPSTTFVEITKAGGVVFADANKQTLFALDKNFEIQRQAKLGEGLVHLQQGESSDWATVMGSFSPTDAARGYIYQLGKATTAYSGKIIEELQRPVHSSYADLNADGLTDLVICEFGKWTGALSVHYQQPDGSFKRQDLVERPGAIKTEIVDLNNDGRLDILALFGQGNEGFWSFLQEENDSFTAQILMRFPPSYGSSSFDFIDMNGDNRKDIVYTAGDNADYVPILKPYHGVYIFLQKNELQFELEHFLPLAGAYRALANDYDLDGDVDMFAISFFPDYRGNEDAVVFFENKQGDFFPKKVINSQGGRWLVAGMGDLGNDGDTDIILGSLTFEVPSHPERVEEWVKNGLPFLILENLLE